MTIWDRIRGVDRRVIYIFFAIILLFPQFVPITLPMMIQKMTPPLFDAIEALQPGDNVFISVEYGATMVSEMSPALHAVAKHLFAKKAKIFLTGTSADGAMYAATVVDLMPEDYEYGVNIVNFGFVPGAENAIASFATDMPKTAPADAAGNPTADMPIMAGIRGIAYDFKLVYQLTGGGLGPLGWIRQVGIPYHTPIATCVSSSMLPSAVPYYEAGNLIALLNGLVSAAEYEILTETPGKGAAGMAGQSLGHLYVTVIVLVGNLAYIMQKQKAKKEE